MNRLAFASRRAAAPSPAFRAATASSSSFSLRRPYSNGSTSAPKSAEKASATSGGSRSKDAASQASSSSPSSSSTSPTEGVIPDGLSNGNALGRTGGGKPLNSSRDPPAQPKISNASVPGEKAKLSAEQQAEVDRHNEEFEKKHGMAEAAGDDKVDKGFWSGRGGRK
ncbi:uncharacterized protein C8A04DRAFT_29839 [Dichotomopilus funicola]|uniref:Uncharacterized protein n=1 Tax=Dichotomopilus funicola TaxID=1934379 RepID=A0AAN6V0F4_9PEZI|nr:hypothetical protein C8A04DRAFT_29839 [Dichotomopilus funicola]